jgi:hypothetical protein
MSRSETYLDVAEIAVFYAEKDSTSAGDVTRTSIECSHPHLDHFAHTRLIYDAKGNRRVEMSINKNDATIEMKKVRCIGSNDGQETCDASDLDVTFHLTTTEGLSSSRPRLAPELGLIFPVLAATQFFDKLQEMRMELFVIELRYPRKNERTVLKL